MGEIFINYRRGDTAGEARALFNELREKIGADAVFMDVDNIALGRDFREVLTERLATVDVMLALIGKEWTQVKDKAGRRRLDDPNDFVRREIRAALERNIAVTPVLLQDAQMPSEAELPDDIRSLAFRNAFELSHTRWGSDVNELIHRLGFVETHHAAPAGPSFHTEHAEAAAPDRPPHVEPLLQPTAPTRSRWSRMWPAAAGVAVLLAGASGAYQYYQSQQAEQEALQQAQAEADRRRQDAEAKLAQAVAEAASQAAAQARLEEQRAAAQKLAEAQRLAEARQLADAQRLAAAKQLAETQKLAADTRQRAEAQRTADAKQAADRAANEQAARSAAAAAAAQAAARNAQGAGANTKETETAARLMAEVRSGKFINSISVGLGDYGLWKSLGWAQLNAGAAVTPCSAWARQLPPDERVSFLASCLGASAFFGRYGLTVGMRVSQPYWMNYCSDLAKTANVIGDDRTRFMNVCLRYR